MGWFRVAKQGISGGDFGDGVGARPDYARDPATRLAIRSCWTEGGSTSCSSRGNAWPALRPSVRAGSNLSDRFVIRLCPLGCRCGYRQTFRPLGDATAHTGAEAVDVKKPRPRPSKSDTYKSTHEMRHREKYPPMVLTTGVRVGGAPDHSILGPGLLFLRGVC
jgi:hypothetical protein